MSLEEKNKYKKIFSNRLNYFMDVRGKTQTDIINDLGINKSSISTWCNGTRLPRMNVVEMLAKYLGVHVSDLINEGDTPTFQHIATEDSMAPLLNIGDIAIVNKETKIVFGKTYLLEFNNTRLIRKIIEGNQENQIELIAMNPYYPPIKTTKEKIKIIGRIIKAEVQSAFK
ncbi:MAG: LexA family transcriptional regulator [Clostridia bacterium]|nr:LexA family transcriptional regulator [Clostridia bacterium]